MSRSRLTELGFVITVSRMWALAIPAGVRGQSTPDSPLDRLLAGELARISGSAGDYVKHLSAAPRQ